MIKMTSKRKIVFAVLVTALLVSGVCLLDHLRPGSSRPREIKPAERTTVYMDMELLVNGKRSTPQPQATAIMGEATTGYYGFSMNNTFAVAIKTRPFQVEGMSPQEVLIEIEIVKLNRDHSPGEVIAKNIVRARNRVKSTLLLEQSASAQESMQLLVTPYFGPLTEDIAVNAEESGS